MPRRFPAPATRRWRRPDSRLTPDSELPFAGHPVLGTAFVVSTSLGKEKVALETGAGLVPVQLEQRAGRPLLGRVQQPIRECEPYGREREPLDALGLTESGLPVELYRSGAPHVYVELESEDEVAALKPDFAALAGLGIAANCFAGSGRSWKTRLFTRREGSPGPGHRIGGWSARTPHCRPRSDRLRAGDRD